MKNCYSLENATCIRIDFKPPKMTPIFPKSKIIQKPQFPSTLLANFWYLIIVKLVSDGKWQYLGLAPLLQTFRISEQSEYLHPLFFMGSYHIQVIFHCVPKIKKSFKGVPVQDIAIFHQKPTW